MERASISIGEDSKPANGSGENMISIRRESQNVKTLATKNTLTNKFLIGEELGFGAFSKVYKGVDLQNGDFVAIKQISLEGLSERDQDDMVKEIDLLRNLHHKNIVKYFGSYRTRMHLYIILEYVENGSLSQIIKPNKFGAFPESLAMVYMKQILEGLAYLHEQDVIHRDIKGANILTTKEGIVKLADFGVATLSTQRDATHSDFSNPVVGTPYWMAPEVIEMSGVTFASDIWSVGCTAIEVLTGMPPYFDMMPMSALFHIVQDEHPPIPDGISPKMQNFLMRCFQKSPKNRPSARELLQHEWFQSFEVPEVTQSPLSTDTGIAISDDEFATPTMGEGSIQDTISLDDQKSEVASDIDALPSASNASDDLEGRLESSQQKKVLPQLFSWLHRRTLAPLVSSSGSDHHHSNSTEDFLNTTHGLAQPYTLIPQTCETEEQRLLLNRQLVEEVKRLIAMMRPEKREGIILSACQQCVALFTEHPGHKTTFMNYKGVVALQEILSKEVSPSVVHSILQLLNMIISEEVALHEHLAMTGLIPKALEYISPQEGPWNLLPIRKEALQFGRLLCTQNTKSLELFLACNGIHYISQLLTDTCRSETFNTTDLEQIKMIELAVDCIWAIVNSADTAKVDDICRLLSNAGVVIPLVHALKIFSTLAEDLKMDSPDAAKTSPPALVSKLIKMGRSSYESVASRVGKISHSEGNNDNGTFESDIEISVNDPKHSNEDNCTSESHLAHKQSLHLADTVTSSSTYLEKIGGLLCILSCSDSVVKNHLCEMRLLHIMLESLVSLKGNTQLMLLTVLKQLSDDVEITDQLVAVGSLQAIVAMLQEKTIDRESQHLVVILEILVNMTQNDRKYLEVAVGYGLVPVLCTLAYEGDKWQNFALPLLFRLSHFGRKCRQELWKNNVPRLFVLLLDKSSWQQKALEALTTWLASDSRIEDFLLSKEIIEQIVSSLEDRDNLLALCHPLLLICHRSPRLNIALSMKSNLTRSLMDNLVNTDATNLLALLRFLDILYQHNPNPKALILTNQLFERLRALSEEEMSGDMLLVKEKAQSLIQSLEINMVL